MTEKEIRREVERAFYEYKERKDRIKNSITEVAESGLGLCYDKLPGSRGSGVDSRIIDAIDRANDEDLWCRVVELTRTRFEMDVDALEVIDKYFIGQRKYRRQRMRNICDDCYFSTVTFYAILHKILNYATMIAIQFNLVSVVTVKS